MRQAQDSLGSVEIADDVLWGAQTQRSLTNFNLSDERLPKDFIQALLLIKKAAAKANADTGKIPADAAQAIVSSVDELLSTDFYQHFPLHVWQTGSGTQTNMNANEVLAYLASQKLGRAVHPNDIVNASQSTNDVFPTSLHLFTLISLPEKLIPAAQSLISSLEKLQARYPTQIKSGRTHLQDAVPLRFADEVSGWIDLVKQPLQMLNTAMATLERLPLGGTAVGTGLNAPSDYAQKACDYLNEELKALGLKLYPSENYFHSLSSRDALLHCHSILKVLATNLMKLANDIRWLASGPNCGLGELTLPANEPGSSIMPGKVNPTQAEALTMIAAEVMGNDMTLTVANSQGNFELNVYLPLFAFKMSESIRILSDGMQSFALRCVDGITLNEDRVDELVSKNLMLVTALSPKIGYAKAAELAHVAQEEKLSLKEAAAKLGVIDLDEFDSVLNLESMV